MAELMGQQDFVGNLLGEKTASKKEADAEKSKEAVQDVKSSPHSKKDASKSKS
jgi:hypothetical protein